MTERRVARGTAATAVLGRHRRRTSRWIQQDDRSAFALLVVLTTLAGLLMWRFPAAVTASALMVPLLMANLLLPPRLVPRLVLVVFVVLAVETAWELHTGTVPARRWVNTGIILVMGAILVLVAIRRARLGVAVVMGDEMLIDLQDRLSRHGRLPDLTRGWYVDAASRAAGGTSFAGDFMVAHQRGDEAVSLVLVDVSGKGVAAGTRSLLLSGAFGGLLGALPPAAFLPAANDFLLRQSWDEGFATAVHLDLDLRTGDFDLRNAGHPPVIHFVAGSGRWVVYRQQQDPVLGLVPDASFTPVRGRLGPGDALLMYTDGLVETPRRDIGLGIDKLVGQAERLVRGGFDGAARVLVDRLGASDDDCSLVVVQRR